MIVASGESYESTVTYGAEYDKGLNAHTVDFNDKSSARDTSHRKLWRYSVNKMEPAIEYIKSDCYRYTGEANGKAIFRLYIHDKTFRWQVAFRLYNATGLLRFVGRVLWRLNRNNSIVIQPRTSIGYGLYIGHGGPVVMNPTAIIGNNCNLSQFTTIGANDSKAATIGDNVYIGPGTCVVEDVRIGNNVTIGAGSVVTKDIPDNATAAGNYAKVLNYNNPGRYINNKWNKEN